MRQPLRRALLWLAAPTALSSAQNAPRATVVDLGPGPSGRLVAATLARPHRLVEPDTGWFVLRRGRQEPVSLVVLGRSAAIEGSVAGDVIVVAGDLYLRPGAHVDGRAVAVGGGVYPSALAIVTGGTEAFRDNTFTIVPTDAGYELAYRSLRENESPPLLFPGVYGLRMPTYDRVDGVSIPFGPSLTFAAGRGGVNGLVTYRSDLGALDPLLDAKIQFSRRLRVTARVGRETVSNDAWIWSDFVNSLSVLAFGVDTRNWFRADRAQMTMHQKWEWTALQIEPYIGGRTEHDWSVGPAPGETRAPWSIFGRTDSLGVRRPNPPILDGNVTSVLAGGTVQWQSQGVTLTGETGAEIALSAPADRRFVQITSDASASFSTFGEQEYALDVHWVTTPTAAPPAQRFVYLGGAGTLPFEKLLGQRGDHLLLIDQRYSYPLLNVMLGIFGPPTLILRHRLASAGLGRLPAFEQVIGAGVLLTILRAEVQMDPATRRARFSAGFSFSR